MNQLQSLQTLLRGSIRDLQEEIVFYKGVKRTADEAGNLEMEYAAHEWLKDAKISLKKFISLQKATKATIGGK